MRFMCTQKSHLPPLIQSLAVKSKFLKRSADGKVIRVKQTVDILLSELAGHVDAEGRGRYRERDKRMFVHPPARDPADARTTVCMLLKDSTPRTDSSTLNSYGVLYLGLDAGIAPSNKQPGRGPQPCSIRMHALMCALRWGAHEGKGKDACHAVGPDRCNKGHKHCINPLHLTYQSRGRNNGMQAEASAGARTAAAARAAHAREGRGGPGAGPPSSSERRRRMHGGMCSAALPMWQWHHGVGPRARACGRKCGAPCARWLRRHGLCAGCRAELQAGRECGTAHARRGRRRRLRRRAACVAAGGGCGCGGVAVESGLPLAWPALWPRSAVRPVNLRQAG